MTNEIMTVETVETKVSAAVTAANELLFVSEDMAAVDSPDKEAEAVDYLGKIKAFIGQQEDARKALVKPLNDHVKFINAKFAKVTDPLETADRIVRAGMSKWRSTEAMRLAAEERKNIEAQAKTAAYVGDVEKMQQLAPQHEAVNAIAPKAVKTDGGKATFRTVYHWEVEDVNKIPMKMMTPDVKKIDAWVKTGGAIEGVKVWTTQEPVIHSR